MKKQILLFVALFFSGCLLQAQTARQYFGVTLGPSSPLSDFSKSVLSDSTSGFARTGIGINVVYAFRMGHNLGFQLNVSYGSNKIDNRSLVNEGIKQYPNMTFNVESGTPWNTGQIIFGPYLRFPIGSSLSLDFRGLIGLYSAYSPDFTLNGTSKTGEKADYFRNAANSYSFGYSIGTGLKYRIDKYYLLLFGDYTGTNTEFNHVTGIDWNKKPYDIPLTQKFNTFRISIGFAYIL